MKRFGIRDPAIVKIAEMVHGTDLEDGKFDRVECVGIEQVFKGWAQLGATDEELLTRGGDTFDALYAFVKKQK